MDNKIIWIGATAEKEYLDSMTKKGNRQSTAYNVQEKFIKGLRLNQIQVDTLNGHVMPPFPRYKGILIPARQWAESELGKNLDAAFWNLPLLNILSKGNGLIRASKKIKIRKEDTIIVYSLHSPFLRTASYLKRKNHCKVIVMIPDLPEYMNSKQGLMRRCLKKIDRFFINKYLMEFDGYVLFAKQMEKRLPKQKNVIVLEGILEFSEEKYREHVENVSTMKNVVMFSGNLNLNEGIERLLDIFALVKKKDCELWITGFGDGDALIKSRAKEDKRIKYWGYLETYDKLLELQKKAKVLVAIVNPENPKSDVFFPSKIMEYLMTGREVICYKLGGIPNEYDKFLKYFDAHSVTKSAELLGQTLDMDVEKVIQDGNARIEFLGNKDMIIQAQKLKGFIDEV